MGRNALRLAAFLTAGVLVCLTAFARFAPLDAPESRLGLPGTVVLDTNGTVLAHDGRDGIRIPVALDAIAPAMLQATISAEDRRFQRHPGIDALAVARALSDSTRPSGASTITQQLARRLYLVDDRSPLLVRKAHEAAIALQLEANRSKAQILGLYLNDVYYGRQAYGVEAASRVYFGISARNLDLAHAAYLAGLPQRPSSYDPVQDPAPARERQAYVLRRMAEDGWITRAEAYAAVSRPIDVLPAARPPLGQAFVAYARAELARVRPDLSGRDGLVIETTLDAGLQDEAQRVVRERLPDLEDRHATDAALVALEPGTGRIVAMVGSALDAAGANGGGINMTLAERAPGSALKPFLYASAFEHGYTPATQLLDVPTSFDSSAGLYTPFNYDHSFHGVLPLRVALASSLNVPAVRTLDALGLDTFLEIAHRFGLSTLSETERYGLGLTLGGGDVRLIDLANGYAALGARGRLATPYAVQRVRDGAGRVLYEHPAATPRRVLSPEHAYLLADILSDREARILGFGEITPFELPFPAAAKSGTSNGPRDTWTIGFTPEITVGVWVGNADGSPMLDIAGVDAAAPIWRETMLAAALGRRMSWYERPTDIVDAAVCAPTGLLPGPDCPSTVRELFVAGTVPTAVETYYSRDADGKVLIDPPLEARAWARDAGLLLRTDGRSAADLLRIVSPIAGTVLYLAPELAQQRLVLRAAAAPGIDRITFEIDGKVVGEAPAADPWLVWALEPGRHTLRASGRLANGTHAVSVSAFEVKAR